MNLAAENILLGNHILVTSQHVQRVRTVLAKDLLEIIANRIGVAEAVTLRVYNTDSGLAGIVTFGGILNIVGRSTPETLVVLIVSVVTELSLQLQVLVNLPAESTCQIQVTTMLLAIVVICCSDRIGEA